MKQPSDLLERQQPAMTSRGMTSRAMANRELAAGGWVVTAASTLAELARQFAPQAHETDSQQAALDVFDDLLDDVIATDRSLAAASALRAEQIDRLRRWSEDQIAASLGRSASPVTEPHGWNVATQARRELVFELMCALRLPERSVETLIWESQVLVGELPATTSALQQGEISYRHATVMVSQAASIPAPSRAAFELALLPYAKALTVSKFTATARKKRESLHPVSITERHRKELDERRVWVTPDADGMAHLTAYLSAELALAAYDRLTAIGLAQDSPDDDRGLDQKRADAFADLLLVGDTCTATSEGELPDLRDKGPGTARDLGHGIRPKVLVSVPVLTLLGSSEVPGDLEGYGPIDADTARDLAGHAPSFTRILTHPVTSAILDIDRTTYAVPADLRLALRVQDGTCRAVGCNRSAARCDIDHNQEFAKGGKTRMGNLAHLCGPCHRMRHHTRVRIKNLGHGDIEWTTPSGKVYVTHPANRLGAQASKAAGPHRMAPGAPPAGAPQSGAPQSGALASGVTAAGVRASTSSTGLPTTRGPDRTGDASCPF